MAEREDIEKILRKIHSVDWSKFTGYEYYKPEEVPWALTRLVNLDDDESIHSVGSNVRFAIGNDHRGTYFDAIEEALKIVIWAAFNGVKPASRKSALNIITDYYCSFCPHPGLYSDEKERQLDEFVR